MFETVVEIDPLELWYGFRVPEFDEDTSNGTAVDELLCEVNAPGVYVGGTDDLRSSRRKDSSIRVDDGSEISTCGCEPMEEEPATSPLGTGRAALSSFSSSGSAICSGHLKLG